jgi:hypothetical protein
MPADWGNALGNDFRGVVRYTRTFNRPTNLDPHEHVWLVIERPRSSGNVELNGEELGLAVHDYPWRYDITRLLGDFNKLTIVVRHPQSDRYHSLEPGIDDLPGGLFGEVRLEIIDE